MQQWIASQLRSLGMFLDDVQDAVYHLVFGRPTLDDLPCVQTITRDGMRVLVRKHELSCGHSNYRIEMDVFDDDGQRWLPMALLRDADLPIGIQLLQEVLEEIEALEEFLRLEQLQRERE